MTIEAQSILEQCLKGAPPSGIAFFRFSPLKTCFYFLVLLVAFLASACSLFLFLTRLPLNGSMYLLDGFLLAVALITGLYAYRDLTALLNAGKSGIALTTDSVIKSHRGKIIEIPYSALSNLKLVYHTGGGSWPQYILECVDTRTRKYTELARGRDFGPAQAIHEVLLNQLRR